MKNMRAVFSEPNVTAGSIFSLLGLAIMFNAAQIGFGKAISLGPGVLPFMVGLFIAVSGFSLAAMSLYRKKPRTSAAERVDHAGWLRMAKVVLCLISWPLLVKAVGYISMSFLVCLLIAKALGYQGCLRSVILSGAVAFLTWFLFGYLFYVDLPAGFIAD